MFCCGQAFSKSLFYSSTRGDKEVRERRGEKYSYKPDSYSTHPMTVLAVWKLSSCKLFQLPSSLVCRGARRHAFHAKTGFWFCFGGREVRRTAEGTFVDTRVPGYLIQSLLESFLCQGGGGREEGSHIPSFKLIFRRLVMRYICPILEKTI
jgi:hypothetical protein